MPRRNNYLTLQATGKIVRALSEVSRTEATALAPATDNNMLVAAIST